MIYIEWRKNKTQPRAAGGRSARCPPSCHAHRLLAHQIAAGRRRRGKINRNVRAFLRSDIQRRLHKAPFEPFPLRPSPETRAQARRRRRDSPQPPSEKRLQNCGDETTSGGERKRNDNSDGKVQLSVYCLACRCVTASVLL